MDNNYIESFSDSHKQELMSKVRLAQFNICSLRKLIKYHLNGKQLLEARVVMTPDTTPTSRGTHNSSVGGPSPVSLWLPQKRGASSC